MSVLNLKVGFYGGAESLFDMQKEHSVTLPASGPVSIADLLRYIKESMLLDKSRSHLLLDKECKNVSPGILVLINDRDWELADGPRTILSEGDSVTFISSIHGG
ncbi:unnamed protein product [Gongylonema pulchrum]|uniref:Ubiquitin-related modifier 1 homolog n=1 Tax=Gongylonema pulchrum TaxID=637853 RepID=A0A183DV48_9BILA|nr:unnamed protein product [Gongylonema pulchrum]VDN26368.1 unnamed protein product [Gongylonema pulchrum]